MVNLSSNMTLQSKSKIPIRQKLFINSNFKSNSTFNLTKIPKIVRMKNEQTETLSNFKYRKNFKRSQSFNTESNLSSLSLKSNLTSSHTSIASNQSNDLIKFIKSKLKDIEKSFNLDELSEVLADENRNHKRLNLGILDGYRLKNMSKSLPNSQLSQSNKFKLKTNTPNLDERVMTKNGRVLDNYFNNLKLLDQLFRTANSELFHKKSVVNDPKVLKYQKKLDDYIQKFSLLIKDRDGGNLNHMSPESFIFSKQDVYKNGEFVLRLIPDLVFKLKVCLKIYVKMIELNPKVDRLPKIETKLKIDPSVLQNSFENFNESFIKETDCSSIMSDDEKERDSKRSEYSNQSDQLDDYKQLKKKIYFITEDLSDLNMYLDGLNLRAERCNKLEDQLKTDRDLIKKTEINLRLYDKTDDYKKHLEKQLEYFKYRFKVNLQDYNIEKICAPEIYTAISNTEFKIYKLNSYLQELNMNLVYIESKLKQNGKMVNKPRQLPPIQQFN